MKKGYIEWISKNKIGFITNPFGRVLYINREWPDGIYEKVSIPKLKIPQNILDSCHRGRSFNKEELMLELL